MLEFLASDYRMILQDLLVAGLLISAFIWGAGPERAIIVTWVLAFEFADLIRYFVLDAGRQVAEVDFSLAGSDLVAAIVWTLIALNANRNYPLWIAGLQVLALSAHFARVLTDIITPIAYAIMVAAPGWLQLFVLAAGLTRHVRRKKAFGPYRDWRIPVRFGGLLPAKVVGN